jgi:hypothetical protein
MRPFFTGTIKLSSDDGHRVSCEFDGSCDASGLGGMLGVAARSHMQHIPPALRDREFRALLAAFVASTADMTPLAVTEGSIEVLIEGAPAPQGRPS